MQNQFRVDVHDKQGATVIMISGELDLASSPLLEEQLDHVFNSGADSGPVVLDLRQLDFMDSTGLSVLVKAHRAAAGVERELCLVKGHAQVQRLLNLTGVADQLRVLDAPEDAVRGG